jgi:hypothetical protein
MSFLLEFTLLSQICGSGADLRLTIEPLGGADSIGSLLIFIPVPR